MSGLVESATAIMRMAERRLDVVAHNVSNISTPGYKRRIGFAQMVSATSPGDLPQMTSIAVPDQGTLTATANPLDLAISGDGYFRVRSGDAILHTRQGQFRRDADGMLVTPQGYVLQAAGGGDLIVDGAALRVEQDGTVMDGSRPVARIAVERPGDGAILSPVGESFFTAGAGAMDEAPGTLVRQGMLESSNVSLGDEMTHSMAALREAESGARLIQLYDELMGKVVNAFGSSGR